MAYLRRFFLLSFLCICLGACAGRTDSLTDKAFTDSGWSYGTELSWQDAWQALSAQLQKDGLDPQKTQELFASLTTPPSPIPMGEKVKELYSALYIPKAKPAKPAPKAKKKSKGKAKKKPADRLGIPGPWFDGIVTKTNARKCLDFIQNNFSAFARAERRYGVPAEVAAALLFVETRLGTYMGRENAFFSLASMAVTRSPRNIEGYLDSLPGMRKHQVWMRVRMEDKAQWAYTELKALLTYCFANGMDPYSIPGSLYGAVGMCQFMPSNIPLFAVDGDRDGVIDIFAAPDAIASLCNYLCENGWRKGLPLSGQVKVLMRYNKMKKYAYTILALAKTMEQLEQKEDRRG